MATITFMHDTIEGTERLLDAIREHTHIGDFAGAQERATLLIRVLDGEDVARCVQCGVGLTQQEIERWDAWCEHDAPALEIRFQ